MWIQCIHSTVWIQRTVWIQLKWIQRIPTIALCRLVVCSIHASADKLTCKLADKSAASVLDDTVQKQYDTACRMDSSDKYSTGLKNSIQQQDILNQTRGGRSRAPGFLKLLWFTCRYVCLSVCVSTPEGINNQWHDMV